MVRRALLRPFLKRRQAPDLVGHLAKSRGSQPAGVGDPAADYTPPILCARARLAVGTSLLSIVVLCLAVDTLASSAQDDRFFDSAGVRIHYVDHGTGEPVVLIHGFTGSYARHFDTTGLMSRLASAGYRVIALDCRGHGQSGKPTDVTKYGLEMARDVVRLLDHLAIDRAHIVGYSMGGQIALKLLDTQPHRLMTATLIGAGWEGEDLTSLTSQLNEAAESLERRDAGFLLRALTPPGQGTPTDEQVAAANESLFARNDPKVLGAIMRGLIQLDQISAEKLHANRIPTLALVGEQDRRVQEVKRLAGVMPGVEVVVIPSATHATSVAQSADHLIAFLGRHGRK